jgi:hypothetical protein
VRRRDVEAELGHEPAQAGDLALGYVHHQAGKRRGVDDRVLERALEPAADQPRVERIVAVLDEHCAVGETEERPPSVLESRRADEHRAVDVVALAGVRVDRRAAVHERVEEGQRAVEAKALGSQLQHEERRVARGLDVEGDEFRLVQRRVRPDLGRVDGDLLPLHRRGGAARLEEERLLPLVGAHALRRRARRAKSSSSRVTARTKTQATA